MQVASRRGVATRSRFRWRSKAMTTTTDNSQAVEFFKADDAARFLNVSRRTFERMRAAGQIPHIRAGGGRVLRYRRAELIRAMDNLTVR